MMPGQLPKALTVNGVSHAIYSDYRNILQIFAALNDDELSDAEKMYVCLQRIYVDVTKLPTTDYAAAYRAASDFIECRSRGEQTDKAAPKIIDWEKDEQLIFAAVNKVAGAEVRAVSYMHWWTFLGYFQSIDRDDILGFILTIRQKKAKHRKLERHEAEFYAANRELCDIKATDKKKEAEDYLLALHNSLKQQESVTKGGN